MEDWVVLSGSDGGDSVELHDGSDVGGSDTESSFAVVQVRGRAADTPAIAVEAVPSQPSPSPPGFFKTVSYGQAFSGIASEHVAASSHAPVLEAAEEDIAEVSPVIVGGEHENAEISDVVESNDDHVDSNIDAATEVTTFSGEEDLDDETDGDIECFDEEDGICEENPDDEIFDDEEESDPEEEDIGSSDLETDSDEYIESTDEESDYEEEDTTDLESDSDEDTESTDEESDYEEEIDDEEIDDESVEEDINLDDELMGFASGLFGDDDTESSTPSQFRQAMQQAAARDQAAEAMVRAADVIDSYMRAAAGGLAAHDVEALSQGATSLRAMAAAPSFAVGVDVSASNAAAATAAAFLPDTLALQDGVVSLAVFYLLFGVVYLLLRICALN
ncbi:hypothetical protein OsI_13773 [Oryza sativa Indica Group]|uniref:Uncharacterized protein n=1 Tax=Oryza sativa subsp. indica TaxID=39946 RepID=A2XMK8_ORYSI|nr:hypothetical protein OsI_13773 [Oryza sativa Indica Group]